MLPWEDVTEEANGEKRKRSEDNSPQPVKRDRIEGGALTEDPPGSYIDTEEWNMLKAVIEEVTNTTEEIRKHVRSNVNTKVEIKKATATLAKYIDKLAKTCKKINQDMECRPQPQKKCEDCTHSSTKRDSYTQIENTQRRNTREASTQTARSLLTKEEIITSIEEIHTLEEWKEIEAIDWSEEVYKNVEVKTGSDILKTSDTVVKTVWVGPNETKMDQGIQSMFRERYPELTESPSDFEVLEQTNRLRSETKSSKRKIIKITHSGTDEDIWNKLQKVKLETKDDAYVAFHAIGEMPTNRQKKMLECMFKDVKKKVLFYAKPGNETKRNNRKTYALVVEKKNKDYNQILNKVKSVLNCSNAAADIRGLRSAKDGKKLIISTAKDMAALGKIQEIVQEASESMKIRKIGEQEETAALFIRGIDALATKEDVITAVKNNIGIQAGKGLKISELRPNRNNTLSATIWIGKDAAKKLTEKGSLRIGMVTCLLEKRIQVIRCRRCWEYSHHTGTCNGVDRTKVCFNCGKEGHETKNCTNQVACPLCGTEGHKADTGRCKVFRTALSEARKEYEKKQTGRLSGMRTQNQNRPSSPQTS